MMRVSTYTTPLRLLLFAVATSFTIVSFAEDHPSVDYLSFSQGAISVTIEGAAETLRVGMDHALLAIDDDARGFNLTSKPGAADTKIVFIFQLPVRTTFSSFAIPNVLETSSPSQTFVKTVEIAGSDRGPEGSNNLPKIGINKNNSLESFEKIVFAKSKIEVLTGIIQRISPS